MITGIVTGHHAFVRLFVRGPGGQEEEVEFVLDTGFAGFLTLPYDVVAVG
jgi:predicted aspartyl protease